MPLKTAAALAVGLPADSRIRMKMGNRIYTADQLLTAHVIDRLGTIVWFLSKSGTARPKSFVEIMTGRAKEEKADIKTFDSADDFKAEFYRITHKEGD